MRQLTLGIAGTAKNTGKTTATRVLLEYFQGRETVIGITSIGYDGERVDNITGLPKPRIFLQKGDLAAVTEKCLEVSSARMRIIARMGIHTPLGRVVCGQVMKEGLMVVAGPNQSGHLRAIKQWMRAQEAGLVIVDGALNRIAPMVETDGFILATGAAHTPDIDRLALETHSIGVICNHPEVMEIPPLVAGSRKSVVWNRSGDILAELPAFLFEPGDLDAVIGMLGQAAGFFFPGVVSGPCLKFLGDLRLPEGIKIIFDNPVKLLLSDVITAHRFVEKVLAKGGRVGYLSPLPLMAVTVNPFYPSCRYGTHRYQAEYVDREALLSRVKAAVDVPVFDVVTEGPDRLGNLIEQHLTGC